MALGTTSLVTAKIVRERPGIHADSAAGSSAAPDKSPDTRQDTRDTQEIEPDTVQGKAPTVTIDVVPESARMFWDDAPLDGNPAQMWDPPDGKHHRLRIEAPGYVSKVEEVVVHGGNTSFSFELQPLASEIIGPISPASLIADGDSVVRELRPALHECYKEGLENDPSIHGKATIVLKVSESGRVNAAEIADNQGLPAKVSACLAYAAADAEFEHVRKSTTVRIPVTFDP
jgi:hypothetical protein